VQCTCANAELVKPGAPLPDWFHLESIDSAVKGGALDPTIDRAKVKKDVQLTSAVKEHGKNWVAVALLVRGRTNDQYRRRWLHCLDPTIGWVRCRWTAEEDAQLTSAV
jgi:hypothetical protein